MFGNHRFGPTVTALVVRHSHRILDDRIEKSIKEDKLDKLGKGGGVCSAFLPR